MPTAGNPYRATPSPFVAIGWTSNKGDGSQMRVVINRGNENRDGRAIVEQFNRDAMGKPSWRQIYSEREIVSSLLSALEEDAGLFFFNDEESPNA